MVFSIRPLTDQEFHSLRRLIYDRFGINLSEQKRSLLVGRLQKFISQGGFSSFGDYYQHVISDKSERALSQLVDRISTNHTFFNREKAHFEFLTNIALPAIVAPLAERNNRDLRIWCAGCSTGEEPYMLVMYMMEYFGRDYSRWDAGILATDISLRALEHAKKGVYQDERLRELPANMKNRYFDHLPDGSWGVKEFVKKEVVFRRFNLMNDRFPFKKPFHMIFCRNVMIYFDQETRDALVARFQRALAPGGYFFIGHSETLGRNQTLFDYLQPATYQKS